jgi:hypothetical protein
MTRDDLTKPLGQGPTEDRRATSVPAIVALSNSLFGATIFWAVLTYTPVSDERDPHIATKAQDRLTAQPALTSFVQQAPPARAPKTITVTIVDRKTGAAHDFDVAAPKSD